MCSDIFKTCTDFLRICMYSEYERTRYNYQGTVNQCFNVVAKAGFKHKLIYFIKKLTIMLVKPKAST